MRAVRAIVLIFWAAFFFDQPAFAEKRVALVMGNSAYQSVSRLANPANDSAAISATFKAAGFDVVELKRDLSVSEMRRALRDFADTVRGADVAIVYFAGHGIEIDGTNYVIPVDAVLERDIDAFDEAIPLDRILTVLEPAKQLRLVILDACRDNPFDKTMKRTIGARAVGRGLAKVEPNSPNTLIAFAAKAGSTASDGDSKNSPFTSALVKYLPRPGLDLRRAFGFTRDDVLKATNNRQEPFIYGSLGGDDVALVPASTAQPLSAAAADPNAAVRRDYELALQISTRPVWDSFINNYPSGFYADLARAQRDRLDAEIARAAATEKARVAVDEQKRLASEGAATVEQAKAAAQVKVAEEARVAAETRKTIEDARVAEVERVKAAARAQDSNKDTNKDAKTAPVEQLAALTPPEQSGEATSKSATPAVRDISRLLQIELYRVGCNTGAIEGSWDTTAQRSLELFNKNAQTKFDVKVASLDALDAVRSKTTRVCPRTCDHGYRSDGNDCIKITCKAGFEVGDDNTCERIEVRKREKPTAKLTPSTEPQDNPQRSIPASTPSRITVGSCSVFTLRCSRDFGGSVADCQASGARCMKTGTFVGPATGRTWAVEKR
jgi:uncharacterized caspase-like protein